MQPCTALCYDYSTTPTTRSPVVDPAAEQLEESLVEGLVEPLQLLTRFFGHGGAVPVPPRVSRSQVELLVAPHGRQAEEHEHLVHHAAVLSLGLRGLQVSQGEHLHLRLPERLQPRRQLEHVQPWKTHATRSFNPYIVGSAVVT